MGVTTRSASSSPVKRREPSTKQPGPTSSEEAETIKVLLLPRTLSSKSRVLSLRHPRDTSRKLFLFCPVHGLYEFTRIAQPPPTYRSLLFSSGPDSEPTPTTSDGPRISEGYVSKDASLLVATAFDLFFLLLSILPSSLAESAKPLFQPIDDLFETAMEEDKHLRYVITQGRELVEQALRKFCDVVEAGDDTMFRVSEEKTVGLIHQKIARVVEKGLPPSMDERFVRRALETPVLSVKRETSSLSVAVEEEADSQDDSKVAASDSQSSTASAAASVVFSEVSATTSVTTISPSTEEITPPEILQLQRLKVALDFIIASYLPSKISENVTNAFSSTKSPVDFAPLRTHLAQLAKLKAEALASRALGDFSRKRGLEEEELAEERTEKKRKQDEEEKRKKATQSRGVKNLAKVNVSGMKKMSAFFLKKPTTG